MAIDSYVGNVAVSNAGVTVVEFPEEMNITAEYLIIYAESAVACFKVP
jgi:hypothetical protein